MKKYYLKTILSLVIMVLVFSGCQKVVNNTVVEDPENGNGGEVATSSEENGAEDKDQQLLIEEENERIVNKMIQEKLPEVDISNWNFYNDEIFELDFKYPEDWKVRTNLDIVNGGEEHYLMIDNNETVLFVNKINNIDNVDSVKKRNIVIDDINIDGNKTYLAIKNDQMRSFYYQYFIKIDNKSMKFYYHTVNIDDSLDITEVDNNEKIIVNKIMETVNFK